MRGQLSAEMIILVAVILAVVAIVAVSVTQSAEKGSSAVGNRTDDILKDTENRVANSAAPINEYVQAQYVSSAVCL